ncbi:MAG TPA: hypothetical protein VGF13_07865 [Verrucomicrobiae bacterium]|jgi:hypothetical protein
MEAKDFSKSDSVSYWAGEISPTNGLVHLGDVSDGTTKSLILDGVPTRTLSLTGARTQLNFYFQIDPTFKQREVRTVRIEVEYLDPYEGTIGVHYDAVDLPRLGVPDRERAYKDTGRKTLTGSDVWKTASFTTREAGFNHRQNGNADFRVWAKTPLLYIRRVTVTRTAFAEEDWKTDYSKTNSVSIAMANESPEDGLRHLSAEPDGRTALTNLDGVVCRRMTREGRPSGYVYFTISPTFKAAGLSNAVCEVEYLCPRSGYFRLQYDAVELETHRPYKSVISEDGVPVRLGGNNNHTRVPAANSWESATFRITDAVFANSQNGGADFRLEFTPPDVFVRRVTLTRETPEAAAKP